VGTIIAFSIIAFSAYLLSLPDFILDPKEKLSISDCMLLACILSSTGTVAALTLVKAEEFPKLNSILFGEGIVNDAVSILLFRAVKEVFGETDSKDVSLSWDISLQISWDFIALSFFSLLIGICIALILSFVFKKVPAFSEKPKLETCMVILTGYLSFLIAEHFHLSGIFCCQSKQF
jgi:NhaP-type Na+/H+ or K+/H+ antiporter